MKGAVTNLTDYPDSTIYSLIEEVQKHKLLYDIPPKDRSSLIELRKRDFAWQQISMVFGMSSEECFGMWKKLRSTFTRHFRNYQSTKDTVRPYNPNHWKYFENLLFLIPYIEFAGPRSGEPLQQNQSAASHIAKRALKRSKNILLKHKETTRDLNSMNQQDNSKVDAITLIELVKQHPVILSNSKSLSNAEEKKIAWKTISQIIGASPRACLAKWLYLWRKLQFITRTGLEDRWVWFSAMNYFTPYITRRSRRSDGNETATPITKDGAAHGFDDVNEVGANYTPTEPPNMDKMEAASDVAYTQHTDQSSRINGLPSPWKASAKNYAEYHFGVCTAEMMEEIPKEHRAKLKAKILQLVANAV